MQRMIRLLTVAALLPLLLAAPGRCAEAQSPKKTFKILHVMSYHSPWEWTDMQLNGFKAGLGDVDAEYKVFQMDTKRNSSEEWKLKVTKEACALIDSWQPDLVFTSDDYAQKYVTARYVNSPIPFVFCGVNADPGVYGFVGSKNIAGVLEQEHFVESVKLLKSIVPGAKKIAVITDNDPTWPPVIQRMKDRIATEPELQGMDFFRWDVLTSFDEYKKRIAEYGTTADAVCLLGIFAFKDKKGVNVPLEEVARWTAENSKVPEFTFWEDRIFKGHLCTVTVSAYEQGYAAGEMARGILVDGKKPSDYPFKPTVKGKPMISLGRARALGLNIKSGVLLSSHVIKKFEWERE